MYRLKISGGGTAVYESSCWIVTKPVVVTCGKSLFRIEVRMQTMYEVTLFLVNSRDGSTK